MIIISIDASFLHVGPDIDTPEKERNRSQELLSSLNLDPTRHPRSSAPIPVQRRTSDAQTAKNENSTTSSDQVAKHGAIPIPFYHSFPLVQVTCK